MHNELIKYVLFLMSIFIMHIPSNIFTKLIMLRVIKCALPGSHSILGQLDVHPVNELNKCIYDVGSLATHPFY